MKSCIIKDNRYSDALAEVQDYISYLESRVDELEEESDSLSDDISRLDKCLCTHENCGIL